MVLNQKRLEVLHVTDTLRAGGKERQLIELLKAFSGRNNSYTSHSILILSDNIHYDYKLLDIPKYQLVRKVKKDIFLFSKIFTLVKSIAPDIIHSWDPMSSIYALPSAKMLNIFFINGAVRDAPPHLPVRDKRFRIKFLFPFSDIVLSNSKAGLKAYRAPQSKSVVIRNGFELNRIKNLPDKSIIKKRFEVTTDFVVGMVASFSDKKDHLTFIRAAQFILEKRQDVTFLTVGAGKYVNMAKKLAGNTRNIKFLGELLNVESVINIFDVGVLATNLSIHGEGISNAIMEYMALGKPVVATDCKGNRELVENGKNGFLVEYQSPELMAERIVFLINNKKVAADFGKNGYERIAKKFNVEKMINNFEFLYRNINNVVR